LHWQFVHIFNVAPHVIFLVLKYSNDLIISLAAVLNKEPCHETSLNRILCGVNGKLTQDKDVQGITITFGQTCNLGTSVRLKCSWDETANNLQIKGLCLGCFECNKETFFTKLIKIIIFYFNLDDRINNIWLT
jgi:hypothetical protein